jgi:epoxide hydrolase-like predicted phosphatase
MVIKAIIFDCFGVLVTSARVVLKNDYPQFKQQIDDLDHQADYGLILRQEFDKALYELIGITAAEVELRYWRTSVRDNNAISWIKDLKNTGKYKIGILSNVGHGFFDNYFDLSDQKELFDEVVLSSDVGMAKPDFMIFELIANRLGVKPDECVMIDDTYINIDAAKSLDMHGIWFISLDQARDELNKLLEADNA